MHMCLKIRSQPSMYKGVVSCSCCGQPLRNSLRNSCAWVPLMCVLACLRADIMNSTNLWEALEASVMDKSIKVSA